MQNWGEGRSRLEPILPPFTASEQDSASGRGSKNLLQDVTLPDSRACVARVMVTNFSSSRQFALYSSCCLKLFMHWFTD